MAPQTVKHSILTSHRTPRQYFTLHKHLSHTRLSWTLLRAYKWAMQTLMCLANTLSNIFYMAGTCRRKWMPHFRAKKRRGDQENVNHVSWSIEPVNNEATLEMDFFTTSTGLFPWRILGYWSRKNILLYLVIVFATRELNLCSMRHRPGLSFLCPAESWHRGEALRWWAGWVS